MFNRIALTALLLALVLKSVPAASYEVTDKLSFGGILAGAYQYQLLGDSSPEYSDTGRGAVPFQVEISPGRTGTDAWAIQVTQDGIPTGLLSIPLRSMHTPIETLSVKDVARTGRLLAHFIASLDESFMDNMVWKPAGEKGKGDGHRPD